MKKINEIKQLAKQVYEYEESLKKAEGKNVQEIQAKIESIMLSLSLNEMFLLDDIIQSKDF